jgi:hypothetical protein
MLINNLFNTETLELSQSTNEAFVSYGRVRTCKDGIVEILRNCMKRNILIG